MCGATRTLLLHEVSAGHGEQMTAGEALAADVACLLYDVTDADSFRYVANIFLVSFEFSFPFLTISLDYM